MQGDGRLPAAKTKAPCPSRLCATYVDGNNGHRPTCLIGRLYTLEWWGSSHVLHKYSIVPRPCLRFRAASPQIGPSYLTIDLSMSCNHSSLIDFLFESDSVAHGRDTEACLTT